MRTNEIATPNQIKVLKELRDKLIITKGQYRKGLTNKCFAWNIINSALKKR